MLIGALLGAAASWWIADKAHTAEMATLNNKTTSMLKQASDEASLQRDRNAQLEHDFASLIAAKEAQHTQELNDALAQNKTLRDAVTSGNRELRLAKADFATCNVSKGAIASAASMGDGTEVRFSQDFGRNIYDIRAGAITDQKKLDVLQSYIRAEQDAGLIAK
ncbi:lysis system i-spanin subunit Rz [Pantoea stewartii]|uniref:lysis system i-spanin subunit Rz n=1 Tax=Pantoea stewartii TaxID=66269 RepID=UPI00147918B7|nr:lysis system i-spanin subunit Rz [Pantoea stewartii]